MTGRIMVVDGRFFDFRHITMTMVGFIGGPVSALIAAIIGSLYRYNVGGSGSMGGISNIIMFACFGSILGGRVKRRQDGKKVLFWWIIGIIMAVMLILLIAFMPLGNKEAANVLSFVAGPYLIITPLVTTIIFNFYYWIYNFLSKASILNTIIKSSPINLIIFDTNGPILVSENSKTQQVFSSYIEDSTLLVGSDNTWMNTTKQQTREISTEDRRSLVADMSSFQMPNGEYACVAILNDVTEMKRMQMDKVEQLTKNLKLEEDLSRGNQLIADSINVMQDGFFALDDQWNLTYVNKKAEDLFRKTREDLIYQCFWKVVPQARGTLFEINFRQAKNNVVPTTFECLGLLHRETWYQVTAYPSQFGLSVYYRDISERKLYQENLIKSQKETALILESMTDCFFALDKNLRFTRINRAAEVAFRQSRDELLGKKITKVFSAANDIALLHYQEVMREKRPITFEIHFKDLGNIWLEINTYPIENGLACYFRDITIRKVTEQKFARLERLNLVGQLAAGIGHEIRNPMTTVRGYLQLLGAKPEYEARQHTFDLMISELDRANAIITEFLSLAQTKQTERRKQDLNVILSDLYPLLEADAFTQSKQICFKPAEIPNLELNEKEITQLILNLARNGLEAMPEGGCLRVKSYVEEGKVVLAIEDEGCGIPPENILKVGTPFFTTKDTGTGLGLATCYNIADSHDAEIQIESNSSGTGFFIFFPISEITMQLVSPKSGRTN